MIQYRIRLEIMGGPIGYHYTDLFFSKWYSSIKELEKNYVDDLSHIEKEKFERRRTIFIEEYNDL